MSDDSKDLKELLVELEYDELDAVDAAAAEARIAADPDMADMRAAFQAVRADLQTWEDVEPRTSRITFVTMPRPDDKAVALGGLSRWTKGLAVAASFTLGIFLAAAFANTELRWTDEGWTFRTGLSAQEPAAVATPNAVPQSPTTTALPTSVGNGFEQPRQRVSGTTPVGRGGVAGRFTPQGFVPEGVDQGWLSRPSDQETRVRQLLDEMLRTQEMRQRAETDQALAGMFQTFDAQRTNDMLYLLEQFNEWQMSTGQELDRTSDAIDFLLTRVGQQREQQDPE